MYLSEFEAFLFVLFFVFQQAAVVGVQGVQRCTWVVAGDTVFGYQGGYQCIGIFVEQAVVAYTQADGNVQIGVGFVQHFGL